MLTPEDIKQITDAQIKAQKEIFFTKQEMEEKFYVKDEIDKKFSNLQNSVDLIATDKHKNDQENAVTVKRIKDLEDWVDKTAPKLGIDFKH